MANNGHKVSANSIGEILMCYGMSPFQLSEALSYKKNNSDILLGEACIRLGFITRSTLDSAIKKQRAADSQSTIRMIQLATERTKRMAASVTEFAAANIALADKLK